MHIDHEAASIIDAPSPQPVRQSPHRGPTPSLLQQLTVADGLLLLILGLAAVLRWGWLGMLPLSAEEAAEAVAVYQFGQGSAEFVIGSPAYFNLNVLLQYFLSATDASVRFLPTVFGLATIALPWLLRDRLGNVGALIASILLAFSPIHQAISRTANGDAMAVFAGMLLFIGWLNWARDRRFRHLLTIAVASALGLSSSALFYSFLDNFIVLWFLGRVLGPQLLTPRPTREQSQQAAMFGAVAFLGFSTLILWNPSGFGAAANQFAAWLQQFSIGEGFLIPWLALLRYETIPLLVGLVAIVALRNDRHPLARWLIYWLFGSILLILVQAGEVTNLAVLTIPLFMLVGMMGNRLFSVGLNNKVGLITLTLTTWGFVFLVGIGRYAKLAPQDIAPLLIAFILLMAAGLILIVLNPTGLELLQSLLLATLCIGLYLGWGTGWALTHHTGNDPRELWVSGGTDADLRLLRSTLQEGSYQISRAQRALTLVSTVDTPAMRWYLRDFDDVIYAETAQRDTDRDAVISMASAPPALTGPFARTDFDAEIMGASEPLFSLNETFRWWFFRESSAELQVERVSLWLRITTE